MRKAKRAIEPQMQLSGTKAERGAVGIGHWFHQRDLSIGTLLAACFVTIIVLTIVADAVAVWQFRRMEASSEHVRKADQALRAVVRVHIDIGSFRDRVAVMANSQDTREFAKDAASLKQKFLDDVDRARQVLIASPELDQNGTISSALETLRTALPAQLDTEVELANAGDWTAVRLRLAHQIQDLRELSLSQLEKVDQQLTQAQSAALETTREARRKLFIVVPMAALVTLLAAAVLGWYLTRSITVPLSELASGAEALARGDFRHVVNIGRNDELAVVARAFNHAARQLQELYEELREQASLLSLTHDAVYVRDMNGVIRYWNRGAEVLYGWPAEQAVGEVAHELLKTVSPLPLEEIGTELLRSGGWEGELLKTKRDGTQIVVASRWSLKRADRGEPVAVLVTSNDVTERKRTEEAVRQSEKQLREVVETIPAIAWTTSSEGSVEFVNKRWQEYTGMSAEESVGSGWTAAVHPKDLDRFVERRRASLVTGGPFEDEVRIRCGKNGEYHWFLSRAVPLRDEQGNIVRWYGTATDIQDRKRAEEKLRAENVVLREEIEKAAMFEEVVGASPALKTVLSAVAKVAPTDSTVLLTGQTGTGKELIARAIHRKSARSARAFISVNCAAIPQSLIASELFGHEKGAFTGALQRHLGRFELAEGGTIFLDEIGELPLETQVALLRVLQEREIQRVGGSQQIRVNVRILAATNRDLQKAIAAGTFREDLFYRLNVFPIHIPPLRERKEDIPMLVEYFIDRFARKAGKNIRSIDRGALELLESYSWPGNIRELQNVVERSVVICDTDTLTIDNSWFSLGNSQSHGSAGSLASKIHEQEREFIEKALAEAQGKVSGPTGAAAKLGISPSALEYKIRLLRINKHQFKKYLRDA
jgi:PAS domain S-box-containing protein